MKIVTLAELRERKNISQQDLAKELDVAPSTIAMYEIGARAPSLDRAKVIAKYFDVPVETIFFGKRAHKTRASKKAI
ncbi:MAG: helix-turn-helix transcriptional regulator [Bacillota bacterium]